MFLYNNTFLKHNTEVVDCTDLESLWCSKQYWEKVNEM